MSTKSEDLSSEDPHLLGLLQVSQNTIVSGPTPQREVDLRLRFVAVQMAKAGSIPEGAVLLYVLNENDVRTVPVSTQLVVGRTQPSDLVIEGDPELSRQHFKIACVKGLFVLKDIDSRNGTFVNSFENRITQRELRDGDIILAGSQVFVFLKPVEPLPDELDGSGG